MSMTVTPMPEGWNTVDKKAFQISQDSFALASAVILFFSCIKDAWFIKNYGGSKIGSLYSQTSNMLETFISKLSGGKVTVGLTFLIAAVSIILTCITIVSHDNMDWTTLDIVMPEQEPLDPANPVNVSLSN